MEKWRIWIPLMLTVLSLLGGGWTGYVRLADGATRTAEKVDKQEDRIAAVEKSVIEQGADLKYIKTSQEKQEVKQEKILDLLEDVAKKVQ